MNAKRVRTETEQSAGEEDESKRRGPKTPDDLRRYAEKLTERANEMRGLADSMQDLGIPSIEIDGKLKVDRGLNLIDQFIDKIDLVVHVHQRKAERGQTERGQA